MGAKSRKPAPASTTKLSPALRRFVERVRDYARQDNARGHDLAASADELLEDAS